MDSEQFKEIIEVDVLPVVKEMVKIERRKSKRKSFEEYVFDVKPYFPGWTETVTEYHENRIHSQEVFPTVLFKNIAPNQNKDELDYIKDTHQCVTSDVFLEFANTVKRGLVNGNIEYKNEDRDAEDFKTYVNEKIPQYVSLYEYMKSLVDQKLTDANAVLAVNYKAELNDNDEIEGRIKPFPEIYNSQNVVYVNPDDSIIVIAHEKSLVRTSGGKDERSGFIFYGYSENSYFVATQFGKRSDYKFEYTEFEHELGWVPAMRLMGSPKLIENKLYFTSPFHRAVPNLNLALLDNANLLLIKRKVGYPTRVFQSQKCRHQHNGSTCDNGTIRWSDGKGTHEMDCPNCNGTGEVGVFGPLSELRINIDEDSEKNPIKASDAMSYVSPDIQIPEFLRKEVDRFIERGKEVLHLKAEPRTSGNITATEKNIDLKATEAFIKPSSDQTWHLYAFLLKTIGSLYLGKDNYSNIAPKVIPAKDFDIISYEDYIDQLSEARKNDLPGYIIQMIIYNLMKSLNYSDSLSEQVFDLIQFTDRLWAASSKEVALSLSRGTASRWEAILHESALAFIFELSEENEGFFDLEIEKQKELLIEKAKQAETEINTQQEQNLPNPLNIDS